MSLPRIPGQSTPKQLVDFAALKKIKDEAILEIYQALEKLPDKSARRKQLEDLTAEILAIDLEEKTAEVFLMQAIEKFKPATQPNSTFQKILEIPRVQEYLSYPEGAALAQTGVFQNQKVQKARSSLNWKNALREPMLEAVRWKRIIRDYPLCQWEDKSGSDEKEVADLFERLKREGITDYQGLFKRYTLLTKTGVWDLTEDQLILMSGNAGAIQRWINENFYRISNRLDDVGNTVVHYLAFCNQVNILKDLLENKKISIPEKNYAGVDFLCLAALGRSYEVLKTRAWFESSEGIILDYAALSGDPKLFQFCMNRFEGDISSLGVGIIFNFARSGEPKALQCCKEMLEKESEEKHFNSLATNKQGAGVQHFAALSNNPLLLQYCQDVLYVDLSAVDKNGAGVQHYSAIGGNLNMLQYCQDISRFDLKAKSKYGGGVQHYAASSGNPKTLQYCLDKPSCNGCSE